MLHASSFLDLEQLEERIRQGFISRRKHPQAELFIYNYTPEAQYQPEIMNDPVVASCRGLILDSDFNVIARPFKKFFNVGEHLSETSILPALPLEEEFEVFEKVDGALGIYYQYGSVKGIATRGSFTSPQALRATRILNEAYSEVNFSSDVTYLFEIVAEESKVVVTYDYEDLVLLAVLDNETNLDLPLPPWPGRIVKRYSFNNFEEVASFAGADPEGSTNSEGYVILFKSGTRAKVKFGEYLRIHKAMYSLSERDIFLAAAVPVLRDRYQANQIAAFLRLDKLKVEASFNYQDPVVKLLGDLPDEAYKWLQDKISSYQEKALLIEKQLHEFFEDNNLASVSRSQLAAQIKTASKVEKAAAFKLHGGESITTLAWSELAQNL